MQQVTFTVDTTPPWILLLPPSPLNSVNRSKNYVYINVSTLSAVTPMDIATLDFNGTLYLMNKVGSGNNVNYWVNVTGVSEGFYDYFVTANDTRLGRLLHFLST
jgi:hypothetical protein